MKKILSLFIAAIAGGFASLSIYNYVNPQQTIYYSTSGVQNAKSVNFAATPPEVGIDFTTAAELSVHGVVHVQTTHQEEVGSYFDFYDPFRDFFRGHGGQQPKFQPQVASGSGVIISEDGFIVTNNHVVEDAEQVEITLNDNKKYQAKVIGTDPTTDLALLKVDAHDLPYVAYGNSDDLKVGEWVLAVGNPFNLTSTVTAGIVSAKGRKIDILGENASTPIESFIQTDAAVNPGNSGGALVNLKGELIGINTAIATPTGTYAGYSFAVPVNIVKKVIKDLKTYGVVQRAYLGVEVDIKKDDIGGVYVSNVVDGSGADEAGIKIGDVITHINNAPITSFPELQEQLSNYGPGEKINVSVIRDKDRKNIVVLLKNQKGNTEIIKRETNAVISSLGIETEELSSQESNYYQVNGGVKITGIKSGKVAQQTRIREGFVITAIDDTEITNFNDLAKLLNDKSGKNIIIEGFYPSLPNKIYNYGLSL